MCAPRGQYPACHRRIAAAVQRERGKEGQEGGEIDVAGGRYVSHVASDFKEKKPTQMFFLRAKSGDDDDHALL